jgi:hypothetical protein
MHRRAPALLAVLPVLTALLLPLAACSTVAVERRTVPLTITTEPAGATLELSDYQGEREIGPAPRSVVAEYRANVVRFNQLSWLVPGLSLAVAAGGIPFWIDPFLQQNQALEGTGLVAFITSLTAVGTAFLSGVMCLVEMGEDGKPAGKKSILFGSFDDASRKRALKAYEESAFSPVAVRASLAGYQTQVVELPRPPGPAEAVKINLLPAGPPAPSSP